MLLSRLRRHPTSISQRACSLLVAFLAVLEFSSHSARALEVAQITMLYDAFGKDASMRKDWGFAAYIEYHGRKILFDTGNNADILEHNARARGIDLSKLDFAVISHRHGDHMGGLNFLLKANPSVKLYVPQENFGLFGAALPGTFYRRAPELPREMRYFDGTAPDELHFGTPWPDTNFTWVTKTTEIAPGLHLILLNGTWGVDLEVKEISLAIDTPNGLVVIVGCSHPTIERILQEAKAATAKPIHLVIGGLHLVNATDDQIKATVSALRDTFGVHYVAPAHCTGEPAFAAIKESFRDKYVYAGLGSTVLLGPKIAIKAEIARQVRHAMDADDLRSDHQALAGGHLGDLHRSHRAQTFARRSADLLAPVL